MIERLRSLATALAAAWDEVGGKTWDADFLDYLKCLLTDHPDPEQGKIVAADLEQLWRELFPERYEDE